MRQAPHLPQHRHKRCCCCHELFMPDPRTKGAQQYCAASSCQRIRQRNNESRWRARNPECLQQQYEQTRQWHKSHPGYRSTLRRNHPDTTAANRRQTRQRMRVIRQKRRFDKSKAILTQLTGKTADACYLTPAADWLMLRLTKASPLSKLNGLTDNHWHDAQATAQAPGGTVYNLAGYLNQCQSREKGRYHEY